jgi:hypothetical protein
MAALVGSSCCTNAMFDDTFAQSTVFQYLLACEGVSPLYALTWWVGGCV